MPLNKKPSASATSEQQILAVVATISRRINAALDLDALLNNAAEVVRSLLQSDRVVVYRFLPGGDAVISVESVAPEWTPILGQLIYDPCFEADWVEPYRQGRVSVINDVETSPIAQCHRDLLSRLQVRANLVVPVICEDALWGLLIAHQCQGPRQWETTEIQLMQQVALQLGLAINQVTLRQQLFQQNQQLTTELVQRTQALQTFRARLQHLHTILDGAGAAIAHCRVYADCRFEVNYWSDGCEQVFGYTREEMMADPTLWRSRILPEDVATSIFSALDKILLGAETLNLTYRFLHKNGSVKPILETLTCQWDEGMDCWQVISVSVGVSSY